MKIPFCPVRTLVTSATCALLTVSTFAQAPAPGAPAAPAVPGATPAAPAGAPAATPAPKPLGPSEKNFIKNAAKSVFFQLEFAKTAKTAVTDPNLVRVRDGTVKDLTKVWEAISKIATSRGEKVTGELTGTDKADVERMGKLKDDKFVKPWVEGLAKESKKLDKDFESAGKSLQDPDLKMFTINYGPLVHGVFTSAEQAEKGLQQKKK